MISNRRHAHASWTQRFARVVSVLSIIACLSIFLPWGSLSPQLRALAASPAGNVTASPPEYVWNHEIVDAQGSFGSIALDTTGALHLAYMHLPDEHALVYAQRNGSAWDKQRVAFGYGSTSLALTAEGLPRISYENCAEFGCQPLYAAWDGTQWVIDSTVGGQGNLVLDAQGRPHLSYVKNLTGSPLTHTYREGTTWITNTVATGDMYPRSSSLQLDHSGNPHISFNLNGKPAYSYWTGSAWVQSIIDPNITIPYGYRPSLALDSHGIAHVAYYDDQHKDLHYAMWTNNAWVTQVVDPDGDAGRAVQLVLDSADNPQIVYTRYTDLTHNAVEYAQWTGTRWRITTVDTGRTGTADITLSMALDANNVPHIVYDSDEGLQLATGVVASYHMYVPVIQH